MADELTYLGLRVLRQVASGGSFAAAADELGYTQSAVSRQMAALETAVGEVLFTRGRRGVTMTPAGEVVLAAAERSAHELETMHQRLAGLRDRVAGRLSIGAFPTAAAVLVPRAIAALRTDHPALEVVLDEAATAVLVRRVQAGRLNVALVARNAGLREQQLTGLDVHRMPSIGLRIVVPDGHRLTRRRVVRPHDLAAEAWIVGHGAPDEPQFGAWPTVAEPRIAYTVRQWTTRLGLVAAGLGISVLPGAMAAAVPTGTRVLPVDDPSWRGGESLLITRSAPDDLTGLAVHALLDQAATVRDEIS